MRTSVAEATLLKHLTEEQVWELEFYLAANPDAGDLIAGTGGWRKLRWAAQGRGKRGGIRTVNYHIANKLIVIGKAYAKNEKENLTETEKTGLRDLARSLEEEVK